MRRLISGDEDAVRALYGRFGRPVFGLGLRMLGSAGAAEELTQDVFLAAWRKGGRYDAARGRLSTWLMAIAHNLAVDRLRRESGRTPTAVEGLEELAEESKGSVSLAKVNVDDNPQLAARYGVRSIPTILFMKDGKVMDQVIGAVPKSQMKKKLDALA